MQVKIADQRGKLTMSQANLKFPWYNTFGYDPHVYLPLRGHFASAWEVCLPLRGHFASAWEVCLPLRGHFASAWEVCLPKHDLLPWAHQVHL